MGRVRSKVFFLNENSRKNIWQKEKKGTKMRQNQKTLIFDFSNFLTATTENSILFGKLGMTLCQYPAFRDFSDIC